LTSRIAILGAGAVALGSAALLAASGHLPVLWSPSGAGVADLGDGMLHATGALEHECEVEIAADCRAAVERADAVLVAVPANGYRVVLDALAAALRAGQPVIISGHLSFGALYLSRALAARGIAAPIVAWGTTAVSGRRAGPASVRVSSVRAEVDIATLPANAAEPMLALCRNLFGDRFRPRDGLLAIALSNVNPQNHLAIALCNFTRIERGETWLQNSNITQSVGRLMEALDAERLAVADAFGVAVRTLRQHFHLSFHTPEAPLAEMARALAARGNDPAAPTNPQTRYVIEDAPFGLHPTALLARMCGRNAVLHEAGLATLSAMYGHDLAADNDILPALDFAAMTRDRLRDITSTGWHA
jgi:opine dehydrogenase